MPIDRQRTIARTGRVAWSSQWVRALAARARRVRESGDGGFTMVEMMVALVIISIVMTALGSFFVSTVSASSKQGSKQAAVQLADDAMERVHALAGSSLVVGRDKATSDTQWASPAPGVAAYQGDMIEAYDATAATNAGASANLPTTGKQATISGLTYTQNWYIGNCWQPVGGGTCGNVSTLGYVPFYRVVVAVTWTDSVCTNTACSYVASTLVSSVGTEPTFLSNLVAQPPAVVNPNTQTGDATVAVTLQLIATGGAGVLAWAGSQLPTGLTVSPSGLISGTPSATGAFSVTVTATDSFGLVGSATFAWNINTLPTITNPGTLNNGVNSTVSYTPTLNGGTGSATWTATGLPAGLSISSSSGIISGTATGAGTSSVVLTATDSLNQAATSTFNWVIYPPLQVTTPADQTTGMNATATSVTVSASGGVTPYTWSTTGLPTGLTISSTGVISGKPTVAGVSTVKVTVSDSDSNTVTTANFKWTVLALTITNPTNNLSSTASTAITPITATTTGGSGSGLAWSVVSGSPLPAGLSLNASTGVISGTPTTVKAYSVILKVTDGAGATDTQTFTWTINTTPNISSPTANQASTAGTAIASITAVASGGTPAYAWSATGLPTGVTIDPTTGVISGTPSTTTGSPFAVSIKVTDQSGATDTQALTWTVNAAMNITNPVANQASTVGKAIVSITAAITAGGGTGTKTWSATSLPAGVTITSGGTISGNPTTAGTYSTVITVTDSVGATDTQAITWTVNAALVITNPTGALSSKKSTTITSITCTATGGTGTRTWSATTLPAGLSINASTGVISGTTSATVKAYSTTVTVTDSLGASKSFAFTWSVTN